jgi:hypothetical protein
VGKNEISRQKTEKQKQSAILFLSRFHIYQKQKKIKNDRDDHQYEFKPINCKNQNEICPDHFHPTYRRPGDRQDISWRTASQTGELTTAGLAASQRATQPSLKRSP